MQFQIGDIELQAGSGDVLSADVSEVYAVVVGCVELGEAVGGGLAEPQRRVLLHNIIAKHARELSLSPKLPLDHFVHLLDYFFLELLYYCFLVVVGFAHLRPRDPLGHKGPQERQKLVLAKPINLHLGPKVIPLSGSAAARAVHCHLHPNCLPGLLGTVSGVGKDVERQFDLCRQKVETKVCQVLLFLLKIDYLPA